MSTVFVGQFRVWQGAALPAASAEHRGKLFLLFGAAGAADVLYICEKKADDSFDWVVV